MTWQELPKRTIRGLPILLKYFFMHSKGKQCSLVLAANDYWEAGMCLHPVKFEAVITAFACHFGWTVKSHKAPYLVKKTGPQQLWIMRRGEMDTETHTFPCTFPSLVLSFSSVQVLLWAMSISDCSQCRIWSPISFYFLLFSVMMCSEVCSIFFLSWPLTWKFASVRSHDSYSILS